MATDSDKLVGLLEAAGLESWRRVSPTAIDPGLPQHAARWHGDEKQRIDEFLHTARQQMRALFTDVRALA